MPDLPLPSIRIGRGGGQPAGLPDFKPMNPWGRAMPAPARAPRPPLYQLVVTRAGRGQTPIGPKMQRQYVDALFDVVDGAIRSGAEKEFSDPHIVRCV
ncbi:MAG: hypothetical protein EPO08_03440 [Rhodospirillaceae bacterium]|nr:MAG: hypothetical protein EPO08_03440 [Rhodospirillaceae bacterium]